MKRLLSILAVFGLSAVGTTSVVACNKTESNNLSRVKTIAAPATVDTNNATKVTKDEIKKALDPNVLKAVQGVVKTAQTTDFVYEVYKDNKGGVLETVNLEASKVDVYVQITPAKDKTVVIGKSGYIKVNLPKHGEVTKADISVGVKVSEQTVEIKAVNPEGVTETELEAVNKNTTLAKAVLDAIQSKVPYVEANEFEITNTGAAGDYSAEKTVEVIVEAKNSSAKITGKLKFNAKVTATKV